MSFFTTVSTVCLESPLSRVAWRVDLLGLRVNIVLTAATLSGLRAVDGRPLLLACTTVPVVINFVWKFLIDFGLSVACGP